MICEMCNAKIIHKKQHEKRCARKVGTRFFNLRLAVYKFCNDKTN